jgi:glycosyltransferase involved in cell wall biosynthesis
MSAGTVLISVVVPTYNYAHYLPRALGSVTAQLEADVEVVVVDDGSVDGTAELLSEYVRRWPSIRVVSQANAGAAAARNTGIRVARGEYVLPLDADDELTPGALQAFKRALVAQPASDLILGAHLSVTPDKREKLRLATLIPQQSAKRLVRQYLLQKRIVMCHSCMLVRRTLLIARPYPENLKAGEDIPVFAYLLVNARASTISDPIARIHKHCDSLRNLRDDESSALIIVKEVFACLPAACQGLEPRYKAQRYLSLFRNSVLARDWSAAKRFYWLAFTYSPSQAMRWGYFRKLPRLLFKG